MTENKKTISIGKEDFVRIINLIKAQGEKVENFSKALGTMSDAPYVMFDTDNGYLEALLLALNRVFSQEPNAPTNTIEWYLYDNTASGQHLMYYEENEVDISSPEVLYDLLCAEFDTKENGDDDAIVRFFAKYASVQVDADDEENTNPDTLNIV